MLSVDMLTRDQKNQLARYFRSQPVDAVYLYGSEATGRTNKLSDIDIAVLFSAETNPSKRFDLRLKYMGDVGTILKREDVEVIDLASVPINLAYQSIFPKILLYLNEKSRDRIYAFETSIMKQYLDFRPMLSNIAKAHFERLIL